MRIPMLVLVCAMLAGTVAQAELVTVTATGSVVFNGITSPPLSGVSAGDQAAMTFLVDSANFTEGVPGDTRGYVIDQTSFSLSFSSGIEVGLVSPFPAGETPYFTLVEGFPASDGFFVSSSPFSPGGVPLEQEPIQFNLDLGYIGSTLTTLDILDALGVYDFTGLTRFGFNLWRIVPDNVVMDIEFQQLVLEGAPTPTNPSTWGRVKAMFK